MTLYAIFERPNEIAPVAVPDKFSWFAALLPPVYALVHGLWLGLILYVAAVIVLVFSGAMLGGEAVGWLYVLLTLLIGFEASAFRRRALRHRGWTPAGDVVAGANDLALVSYLQSRSAA